jgi:hypothetical protein
VKPREDGTTVTVAAQRAPEAEPGEADVKNRDFFGPAELDKSPGDHSRGNRPLALPRAPCLAPSANIGTGDHEGPSGIVSAPLDGYGDDTAIGPRRSFRKLPCHYRGYNPGNDKGNG